MNKIGFSLLMLFCLLISLSNSIAMPTIKGKDSATLIFTMWDLKSDKTYLVDLELNVFQMISKGNEKFELDIKTLINSSYENEIEDFRYVRWSVMGAVLQDESGLGMYMGSYNHESSPDIESQFPRIKQRINRIQWYFELASFSKGIEGKYEVSLREPGRSLGNYAEAWQGNINSLTNSNMEGKLLEGVSKLELWSLQYKIDLQEFMFEPSYEVRNHGVLTLNQKGILQFQPVIKDS